MTKERVYGEIAGAPEGTWFPSREAVHKAGVHRPLQAGISGGQDGADSIVVSGGYDDDEDFGDEIIYTGHGGRGGGRRQKWDQELESGNLGLVRSQLDERPVRVIRGAGGNRTYSPKTGYRYDGLFQVVDHWSETSKDGPRIWRFRLIKIVPGTPAAEAGLESDEVPIPSPGRSTYTGERVNRDPAIAKRVKNYYGFHCQACNLVLMTPAGPHAEGAHIRALGRPHNGPDTESNMLCLCRNCHFLFDQGAIYVDEEWQVCDTVKGEAIGPLRMHRAHKISPGYLRYHRDHHGILNPRGT